jgi:hypothetical protein
MMAAWNPGFERMAALPAEFWSGDKRYDRYIRLLADRGELGDGDPADIVQSHLDASRQQMPYPRLYRPYPLAAALGHLGRGDEARFALKAAVAASPSFLISSREAVCRTTRACLMVWARKDGEARSMKVF